MKVTDSASPEEVPVFLETENHTFQGLSASDFCLSQVIENQSLVCG